MLPLFSFSLRSLQRIELLRCSVPHACLPVPEEKSSIQDKPDGEPLGVPPPTTEPSVNQKETNTETLEKDIKRGEWWLIRVGIATLLINSVIAFIYWGQLKEMRKATRATQDAVGVASRTLNETQTANAKQAIASQEARIDAQKASDASAKEAESALQATIEDFHQEQRAWIGIEDAVPVSYEKNDSAQVLNLTVHFTLHNYGRSAAEHVRIFPVMDAEIWKQGSFPCDDSTAKSYSGEVILPTQHREFNQGMTLTFVDITKALRNQNPKLGNIINLRVRGCIEYTGAGTGKRFHSTPFSYFVFRTDGGGYINTDTQRLSGAQMALEPNFIDGGPVK
jgi:Sec-independent protein translocase protein TatA